MLSPAEIEHFVAHGFVRVPDAIDPDLRRRWLGRVWTRIGYDPADRRTWREGKVHMPDLESLPMREAAPRAYAAACQLLGGEERLAQPASWGDGFIANFRWGDDQPWIAPGPQAPGWHKDGDFFIHFLDSPEQGLLTIVLWDDVLPKGGATFMACDSVAEVARHLAAHPEGVNPNGAAMPEDGPGFPHSAFIARCRDFREATGAAGDVFLMHPFMLHASSYNHGPRARFITNPPLSLAAPMRFDRPRPEDHSPVERAILRGLGVERLSFAATTPRRQVVPPRVAHQERLRAAERARLAAQQQQQQQQ